MTSEDDDIGRWYSRKAQEAKLAWAKVQEARDRGEPREVIRKLELEAERAGYVGD